MVSNKKLKEEIEIIKKVAEKGLTNMGKDSEFARGWFKGILFTIEQIEKSDS